MERARRLGDILVMIVVVAAVWEAASLLMGAALIVPPLRTVAQIGVLLARPTFWGHVEATMLAFLFASVITIVLGVLAGLWLGANRVAAETGEPALIAFGALPKVTLYPIILMLCGLGLSAKVVFGAIHGVVPVTVVTMGAVQNIPVIYLRTGRALRLSSSTTFRHVLLPAVLPEIFSGLRIGLSLTLLGVILGEMFASTRGLGSMLMTAIGLYDMPTVAATTLLLVLIATVFSSVMLWLDGRLHHRE